MPGVEHATSLVHSSNHFFIIFSTNSLKTSSSLVHRTSSNEDFALSYPSLLWVADANRQKSDMHQQ